MRVVLCESSPEWQTAFKQEAARLNQILGPVASSIEHMGSTSIPDLAAKPVVDILAGVTSIDAFEAADGIALLQDYGYLYLSQYENMFPYRRLFTRDADGVRLNNLHIVAGDHPWFQRHMIFRDYLRSNDAARRRYENTKRSLAQQEWDEVNDYAGAKTEIIVTLEEEAFEALGLPCETRDWLRSSRVD